MTTIYFGIIEDRNDPLKLGRCKVRVVGLHTHNIVLLPTSDLPWATVVQPVSGGSNVSSMAPTEGTEVMVVFADEPDCQMPVVIGIVPTLPQKRHVWVDDVPPPPKIKDALNRDVPHSLPKSVKDDAIKKVPEIKPEPALSIVDQQINQDTVAAANTSTTDSIKMLGSPVMNSTAAQQSIVASDIQSQYGQAEPMPNQSLVLSEIEHGSESKAIFSYAEDVLKSTGLTVLKDIILGRTTCDQAIENIKYLTMVSLTDSNGVLGKLLAGTALGQGLSSLAGGIQSITQLANITTMIKNEGTPLGYIAGFGAGLNAVENVLDNVIGFEDAIGDLIGSQDDNDKDSPETNNIVANTLEKFGVNQDQMKEVINNLTGPAGVSFSIENINNGITSIGDPLTNQIRDLLATGARPVEIVEEASSQLASYGETLQRIMEKAAIAGFVTGINATGIATSVSNFFAEIAVIMRNMLKRARDGANSVIQWCGEQIQEVAAAFLDVFAGVSSLIARAIKMIPFINVITNVIINLVAKFLPGDNGGKLSFGVGPIQIGATLDSGTYSSAAFEGMGNRKGIDEQGKGNVTTDTFANVGPGNTPPVHGQWGGPNYGGSKAAAETAPAIDPRATPSLTMRKINTTVPEIEGVQLKDAVQTQLNIQAIDQSAQKLGLATPESEAAFLAVTFAYSQCIPSIADYEYTEANQLISKFPRTFARAPESTIGKFLFARSMSKYSAKEFYGFVYDSANDGCALGNTAVEDGYRYAEAGLLPLVGRNSYRANNVDSAQALIDDFDKSVKVASQLFLRSMQGVPAGNINACIQTAILAFGVDKQIAIKAYEHFYGASVYDSYKLNDKIAGNSIDSFGYYGSAQEDEQIITGFCDPNGKYPYNRNANTSTLSKLATGDSVNTIVTGKEANRRVGIPIANGQGTWDQPHSCYAAKYPYNTVRETESGHVQEFDDTPGAERIHTYHRSGTFEEIDPNGTRVTRIIGDNYTIIDRNGFISIAGTANVTVTGNINIYCQSDANIEVDGSAEIKAHGNMNLAAANDINLNAGGNINMWSGESTNVQCAKNMHIMALDGSIYGTAGNELNLVGENDVYLTSNEKNISLSSKSAVSIEGQEKNVNIKAGNNMNIEGAGSLMLKAGSNAALSAGIDIDINAIANMRLQSSLNMNILTTGWYRRTVGIATDISSGGYYHVNAGASAQLNAVGAVQVNAGAVLTLQSTGNTNVKSTGAVMVGATGMVGISSSGAIGIQAGAAASLTAGGPCGINGSVVGLNSGFVTPAGAPLPAVMVPVLPAGIAMRASSACSAVQGDKAVVYGMQSISPRVPCYPMIPPLVCDHPLANGEQIIEDESQLNTAAGSLITNTIACDSGRTAQVRGPVAPEVPDPKIDHRFSTMAMMNRANMSYSANTKISEHFVLTDMFDGGFNVKHILQDQAGLTQVDIVENLCNVAENVLEPLLDILPGGIKGFKKQWIITSGFRTTRNNARTGGSSKASQHCLGQAVDIQICGKSKAFHYELIQKIASMIRFDQLILEYSPNGRTAWIHCSYSEKRSRRQCLTINLCLSSKQTSPGFVLYA